jgi:hypothetical protein
MSPNENRTILEKKRASERKNNSKGTLKGISVRAENEITKSSRGIHKYAHINSREGLKFSL